MRETRKMEEVACYTGHLMNKKIIYKGTELILNVGAYHKYTNLCLSLLDPKEGPYAFITTNISNLPADEFAVDVNNFPDAIEILQDNKIAEDTGRIFYSGFCAYPIYRLLFDN